MGVRRREHKVLLDAHHDAPEHPDQQNHDVQSHHQRSDHPSFPVSVCGLKSHLGEPELTHYPPAL
jgi:hypothetical protein